MSSTHRHAELGYRINDADNHFNEPPDCFERYIDPDKADLAIRYVTGPDGSAGPAVRGPAVEVPPPSQVTFSNDELAEACSATRRTSAPAAARCPRPRATPELGVVPGHAPQPAEPAEGPRRRGAQGVRRRVPRTSRRRSATATCGSRSWTSRASTRRSCSRPPPTTSSTSSPTTSTRCTPTSAPSTGGCTKRSASSPRTACSCRPTSRSPTRSWRYRSSSRSSPTARTMIQTKSGHAHGGARQPVRRPLTRPIRCSTGSGSICNEAGVRLAVHLGGTDYQKYGADWSEDPDDGLRRLRRVPVDDVLG